MRQLLIMLVAICLGSMPARAQVADCMPRPIAPGHFLNSPPHWSNDSGPILRGFLELQGQTVFHGIDLSHNNGGVPYAHVKACGASFAIVKMDQGFAAHRQALVAQGIAVIPYNFLSVADQSGHDYKLRPGDFSTSGGGKLDDAHFQTLLQQASIMGRWKAGLFISRYQNTLAAAERIDDLGGIHGSIVVVDVEETFQRPSTEVQRLAYARFYARMLSTWIGAVREQIPGAIFIFYTFPDVYTSYLQYALPEDNAVTMACPCGSPGHAATVATSISIPTRTCSGFACRHRAAINAFSINIVTVRYSTDRLSEKRSLPTSTWTACSRLVRSPMEIVFNMSAKNDNRDACRMRRCRRQAVDAAIDLSICCSSRCARCG